MSFLSKVVKKVKKTVKSAVNTTTAGLGLDKAWDEVDQNLLGGAEKDAAKKAAEGQKAAGKTWDAYGKEAAGTYQPYIDAGSNYLAKYMDAVNQPTDSYTGPGYFSFNANDLYSDPSYQFRLNQGLDAVNRAGGAAGKRISGNRLLDLNNYAQGMASTEYQNAYNRALQGWQNNADQGYRTYLANYNAGQDQTNRLADLVNLGYGALNNANTVRLNATQGKTGTQIGAANALAGGELGKANAIRNTLSMGAQALGAYGGVPAPAAAPTWQSTGMYIYPGA